MTDFDPRDAFGLLRSYSRHRDYVRLALLHVVHDIERRSLTHDASKMLDDEFAGFARINAIARVNKFGSDEYTGVDEAGEGDYRPALFAQQPPSRTAQIAR